MLVGGVKPVPNMGMGISGNTPANMMALKDGRKNSRMV